MFKNSNDLFRYLFYLSLFELIIDSVLGILTFLNFISSTLASIYNSIWVIKLFICISIYFIQEKKKLSYYSYLIILFALVNIIRGFFNGIKIEFISDIFFYLIAVFGIETGRIFYSKKYDEKLKLSKNNIKLIFFLILFLILLYYYLFTIGRINYFGLGVQLYLLLPIVYEYGVIWPFLIFFISLLTGKRSMLIILLVQFLIIKKVNFIKSGTKFAISFLILFFLTLFLYTNTNIFARFENLLNFDFSLLSELYSQNTQSTLYIATSGRSQEIFSYFDSDLINTTNLIIGSPVGSTYTVESILDQSSFVHHYFHFSPFNFLKIFGVFLAIFFMYSFFKIFFYLFKLTVKNNFITYLFVGYFISMFFGSIVMIDILFWFSFGYTQLYVKESS